VHANFRDPFLPYTDASKLASERFERLDHRHVPSISIFRKCWTFLVRIRIFRNSRKIMSEPIESITRTDPAVYNTDKTIIRLYASLLDVSLERKPGWRFTARHSYRFSGRAPIGIFRCKILDDTYISREIVRVNFRLSFLPHICMLRN